MERQSQRPRSERSSSALNLEVTRQNNPDIGEFAGLCVDFNGPRMLFDDDVVTDGQAQSGSFAGGLGCKERIEHPLLHLGRHAGAVVADPDLDAVAEILGRGSQNGDGEIACRVCGAPLAPRDEARRIAANIIKLPEFGRFARDQRCGVDTPSLADTRCSIMRERGSRHADAANDHNEQRQRHCKPRPNNPAAGKAMQASPPDHTPHKQRTASRAP